MEIGKKLHGFKVSAKTYVGELEADVYTLEHERCGARLTFVARDDENKTFSISFKTLPEDSTGVFHILEHSVLCGSDKYPVKDPFVELLKGSLNTFLNAMTFDDKTMYPVSSRNDKDFLNMVDVYMDAVLHPLSLRSPNAFYQEGWHYEVDEESGEITYKGVVLNEMRGVFSSPDAISERQINAMLYEGTPYAEDSGGDPAEITKLTYEDYCQAHARFYHPSNAELFLDGNVKLDEVLPLLDSFLKDYDRQERTGEIPVATITEPKSCVCEYEAKPGEDTADKGRIAIGMIISRFDEHKKLVGTGLLLGALFSNNESDGKKAIMDSGLCEDFDITLRDGVLEPSLMVDFTNVKDGREEELLALFRDTVSGIIESGIDKEELCATLNAMEFKVRERNYGTLPIGVVNAIMSLETLLYSSDPVGNFRYEDTFGFLRERISDGSGYYESLLREILIDNPKRATVIMHPSLTLAERRLEGEKKELAEYAASLSESELEALKVMNRELVKWQEMEDAPEDIARLPRLSIEDIPTTNTPTPIEVCEIMDTRVIKHDLATAGIVYTDLFFDISEVDKEDLVILHLHNILLSNLATERHDAQSLQRAIKMSLGGFYARLCAITNGTTPRIYFQAGASALESQKNHVPELVFEIIEHTVFDDEGAIRNILRQALIALEESFTSAGHQAALLRAAATVSVESAIMEYYSGYEAYVRLKDLNENFDARVSDLKTKLYSFKEKYIERGRLTVSVTGPADDEYIASIIDMTKNSDRVAPVCRISTLEKRREGIAIPAQVAFATTCGNIFGMGEEVKGSFEVARKLVGLEFLWSRIRVRGGAYGAGMKVSMDGNISFYSYRDPSPASSLECYCEVADFIREFVKSGGDITKYIIGAAGDVDPIKTPRVRGAACTLRYLSGRTYEDAMRVRRQLLETDSTELLRLADVIEAAMQDTAVCVVGGIEKLESMGLDEILKI